MKRLLALLLIFWSAPAVAAVVKVQSNAVANSTAAQTQTHTMSGAPANGSTVVLGICARTGFSTMFSGAGASVTQTGVTWHRIVGTFHANGLNAEIWYGDSISGAGAAITIDAESTRTFTSVTVVAEYTGLQASGVLDKSASDSGAVDNSANSGTTATTTQADELLVGVLCARAGNTFSGQAGAPASGWTEEHDAAEGTNAAIAYEQNIVSSTVAAQSTATISGSITNNGVIATFNAAPTQKTLTISKAGAGKGRVTSSPAGVACGTSCAPTFNVGQVVTLTAEAVGDSTFSGWSGDADCSDGSVTMSVDVACTATFALKTYRTLTVTKAGSGTGRIRSAGREVDTTSSASHQYIDGGIEWLNAYPFAGSVFAGWSGTGCPSASVGGSVNMNADRSCTATFNLESGASVLYYVRAGGNTACTGLTDADGASGACAKATLSQALAAMSCTNGDDIIVRGATTYSDAATTQTPCDCPSREDTTNGPCIIQFDGTTTVMDPGASAAALSLADGTSNTVDGISIISGRFKGGTKAGIRCRGNSFGSNITILDSLFTDMSQFPTKEDPLPSAIQIACDSFSGAVIIDGVTIDGDETSCINHQASNGARVCGTNNASGVFSSRASGVDLRNSTIRDLRGGLGRPGSDGVWQDNYFLYVWCDEDSVDDGCVQLYNHSGDIFRRNQFWSVQVADPNGQAFKTMRSRRTSGAGSASGMTAYNNMFWGEDTACSGTTSACPDNSWGTDAALRANVLFNDPDGAGAQSPHAEFNVSRNVFANFKGGGASNAINTSSFTNGSSVCPVPDFVWEGDIFYNSDPTPTQPNSCTGTRTGYDSSGTQVDPGLDPNGRPTTWAESCFPVASSEYTARDGDTSDPWVGWSSGACLALTSGCSDTVKNGAETDVDCGGGTCPTCANGKTCAGNSDCTSNNCVATVCTASAASRKVINLIISRLSPGVPPLELWRRELLPGEVIGIWEDSR